MEYRKNYKSLQSVRKDQKKKKLKNSPTNNWQKQKIKDKQKIE